MDVCDAVGAEPTSNLTGWDTPAPSREKPRISERRACRVCGRGGLIRYLNFGMQPLANALREPGAVARDEFRAPLAVQACPQCKLSQLTHVVDPALLYTEYAYRSGVSPSWRAHCAALARGPYALAGDFVLDIAANDGTLLQEFAKCGTTTLGIEPSPSFADCDYPRITDWWSTRLVAQQNLTEKADLIVAQNVLGHVDDVHDFLRGIALALKPNGLALVEVPYVLDLFDTTAFDTIYHEHLSYWSVTALKIAAERAGLALVNVEPLRLHGGSIRATLAKSGKPNDAVARYLVRELHDLTRSTYMRTSARVTRAIARINEELLCQTPYVGFGAAAKTTVMLGCLDSRAHPYVVYDENPHKQGKRIPGTNVPIEAPPADWRTAPGPMCNFVWTQPDVVTRLRAAGYDGAIYSPLPRGVWDELE